MIDLVDVDGEPVTDLAAYMQEDFDAYLVEQLKVFNAWFDEMGVDASRRQPHLQKAEAWLRDIHLLAVEMRKVQLGVSPKH